MNALTHKLGLELDLASAEASHPDQKNELEGKILREEGITYAMFSKEHPDVIIIEYDPFITTPDDIYKVVKRINGGIKRTVFL